MRPVVMREHLVAHNGIGHLGGGHQVHLQQPRLQRALGRPVVFEGVQQEGRALLNLKKNSEKKSLNQLISRLYTLLFDKNK